VRFGVVQQQTLTAGQEFGATAIGQESEETNADKAAGQDMQEEASQELLRRERHLLFPIAVGVILPAEGNLVVLESQETLVGDGHAMGVASEIAQHMMGTTEGWLGIDDPVLAEQWAQEGAEGLLVFEGPFPRKTRLSTATWERFAEILRQYPLLLPRITQARAGAGSHA